MPLEGPDPPVAARAEAIPTSRLRLAAFELVNGGTNASQLRRDLNAAADELDQVRQQLAEATKELHEVRLERNSAEASALGIQKELEAAEAKAAEAEAERDNLKSQRETWGQGTASAAAEMRRVEAQHEALTTALSALTDPKRPVPTTIGNDDYRPIHVQGYRHAMKQVAALLTSPSAGTQEGR